MNKELKAKWVAALRSDKYKQGKGALREDDRFCCIGVLCDLIDNNGWNKQDHGEGLFKWSSEKYCALDFLPADVSLKIGLPKGREIELATLNDDGESFNHIANYIENNL